MKRHLQSFWFLSLMVALALLAIVVFALPYVPFGAYLPFESWGVRLLTSVIILLLWGMAVLGVTLRNQGRERSLAAGLVQNAGAETSAGVDSAEVEALQRGFEKGIEWLRQRSSARRVGQQYLYELPWYAIVGPPAAGKTTALTRSGIELFAEDKLQGSGGTRNCDWWFADGAVLLDTAGRFATQEVHADADRAAWNGFLDLLRRFRPRRPLNGVIVAVSIEAFLDRNSGRAAAHARDLKARILELYERLRVRLPIYVMVTKCDLLSGFVECFDDFDEMQRAQVWGFTRPVRGGHGDARGDFEREFDALVQRLDIRRVPRMQSEVQAAGIRMASSTYERGRIFQFVEQFASLRDELGEFLSEMLDPGPFVRVGPPLFRGLYFTSGTQAGAPFDRLIQAVAPRQVSGDAGRSYFIRRLFEDVIFHEANLAGSNPVLERRAALLRGAIYAVSAVAVVAASVTWWVSYTDTAERTLLVDAHVEQGLPIEEKIRAGTLQAADSVALMDRYAEAQTVFPIERPWWSQATLYVSADVGGAARGAYQRIAGRHTSAWLAYRIERAIADRVPGEKTDFLGLLRGYLLLGDERRLAALDDDDRDFLLGLGERLWASDPMLPDAVRQGFLEHLPLALESGLHHTTFDENLVFEVRQRLLQDPREQQVLDQIRAEAERVLPHTDLLAQAGGKQADALFTVQGEAARVSPFFTRDYFRGQFLEAATKAGDQMVRNAWVLGDREAGSADRARLLADVIELYEDEYARAWYAALDALVVRDFSVGRQQALDALSAASTLRSPILRVLETVAEEVKLVPEVPLESSDLGSGRLARTARVAGRIAAATDATPPGARVEAEFADLLEFIGSGQRRPVRDVMQQLQVLRATFDAHGRASEGNRTLLPQRKDQLEAALSDVESVAVSAPAPMGRWLQSIVSHTTALMTGERHQRFQGDFQQQVATLCKERIEPVFPVRATSRDSASLRDFAAFFGTGGVVDTFTRDNIGPLAELPASLPDGLSRLGMNERTYAQVLQAAEVNRAMFGVDGNLNLAFSVSLRRMPTGASRVEMQVDDVTLVWEDGDTGAQSVRWPGRGGRSGITVTVAGAGERDYRARFPGSWGVLRWVRASRTVPVNRGGADVVTSVEGLPVQFRVTADGGSSPVDAQRLLAQVRCPGL